MRKKIAITIITFGFFVIAGKLAGAQAKTIYVDQRLSSNCTNNYSVSNRNCTGTNGSAYTSVASGLSALAAGDTLYIREGNYTVPSLTVNVGSATLTTTISAYNNESVTLTKNTIRLPLFFLNGQAQNITFYGLRLVGQITKPLTGTWTNVGNNVWSIPFPAPEPTQINFNRSKGTQVSSLAAVTNSNNWFWSNNTLYVYATGNPATTFTSPGMVEADDYDAVGIGQANGTAGNLITVDNCTITNFAHAGIKGNFRYHVKNSRIENIGTDSLDHGMYLTGIQTAGKETVVEYNYLGFATGGILHYYSNPAYIINRYNIINGTSGTQRSFWGVLLSGSNISVYNNVIYGTQQGLSFFRANARDAQVYNNVFYNNSMGDFIIDGNTGNYPTNLSVSHNFLGSATKCLSCSDRSSQGGNDYRSLANVPPNFSGGNPFIVSTPSEFLDFRLSANSSLLTAGKSMGGNQLAWNPNNSVWPPQAVSTSTWSVGVYSAGSTAPVSPTPSPSAQPACQKADINQDMQVNLTDYSILVSSFLKTPIVNARADLNGDGSVNLLDYSLFVAQFLKSC